MTSKSPFVILIFLLVLSGCSTDGTVLPIGPRRAPSEVNAVEIFTEYPAGAVLLGKLTSVAATDDYPSKQRTQDAALEVLLRNGAKLGANGIVVTSSEWVPYGSDMTRSMGFEFLKIHFEADAVRR